MLVSGHSFAGCTTGGPLRPSQVRLCLVLRVKNPVGIRMRFGGDLHTTFRGGGGVCELCLLIPQSGYRVADLVPA